MFFLFFLDGFVSVATSELNKKFKVVSGDMFVYHLPKIDNTTEFDLISGPYGATVMENGTLSWKAMSNLIADSWSELFIIKAKGKLFFHFKKTSAFFCLIITFYYCLIKQRRYAL